MSNKKKFSSFNEQQSLTEGWRKHLSLNENKFLDNHPKTKTALTAMGGYALGKAGEVAYSHFSGGEDVKPLKLKNLPRASMISVENIRKDADDILGLVGTWGKDEIEFNDAMIIIRGLNNTFYEDEDTGEKVPAMRLLMARISKEEDEDDFYEWLEGDNVFGEFAGVERMKRLSKTFEMQKYSSEEEKPEEKKSMEASPEEKKAPAVASKVASKRRKKVNRTIEAYEGMGEMLASKGHSVPSGHRGRLRYINDLLRNAGKSFKNGDWKNYAGMRKVLAAVASAAPEENSLASASSSSDEELEKRIAAKKAKAKADKLKNWKVPPNRNKPPFIQKRMDQIDKNIGLEETIIRQLKDMPKFKYLFKEVAKKTGPTS